MNINSYAAKKEGSTLESHDYELEDNLQADEVTVQITHCGICHSDLHLIDNDWGISSYPMIPGHEIIGTIQQLGSHVMGLTEGQRVGIGWQCGACLRCEQCLEGYDNLCSSQQATCVGRPGGFASKIRVSSHYVFPIPDNLASENAAPLLCAGATVYSPLRIYDVRPAMKVGVIGIGGLGHLALQFASAFGCEVTAFSSSPNKEEEARSFGAHHFVASQNTRQLRKASGSLDFILSTVFANLDWPAYVSLLKPRGRLCVVGAPAEPLQIPAYLLLGHRSVCGSQIGSRIMIREMLEFAARHQILAKTEIFEMKDANLALERVRKNEVRYRAVLKNVVH
ncbi:MAG: NAD(P)-dependent alcohol dehydrogenase [SAR324 cluster bacterium]|nr:NAD(P)-dependent alcohol dehydrogenase [SAR324 cluster bacterium]